MTGNRGAGAQRAYWRAGDTAGIKRHTDGIVATAEVFEGYVLCGAAREARRKGCIGQCELQTDI